MNRIEISESAMMETLNALCGGERAQIVREVYQLIDAAEQRGYVKGITERNAIYPESPAILQQGTEDGIYQAGYDEGYRDAAFDKGQDYQVGYDEGFNDGVNSVDFEADENGSTGYDVGYQEGFEDGFKDAQANDAAVAFEAYENGYAAGVADERINSDPLPGAIEYTEEEFYRAMDEAYERGFTDCSRNS